MLHFGATFYFGQDTLKGKSYQYPYQFISKRKAARKIISIQLLHFYNEEIAKRLHDFGITEIAADEVILKPYLLK